MTRNAMFSYTPMLANRLRGVLVLVSSALVLAACSASPVIDTKGSFSVESPYQKRVAVDAATACEGARRALLGDGYVISSADADNVKGRKAYRSAGARSTFVEMDVVCVRDPTGSTLYASGLLSTFEVKKSAAAASVGVSAIGSLSLPIGQSADSMVKISDETISDRGFYQRFFVAVDAVLARVPPEQAAPNAGGDAGRGVTADVQEVAPHASESPVIDIKESFSVESPYQRKAAVDAATACEGARRALLGDGYVISSADADNVKGRKAYRSAGARSTFIEMDVVCVRDPTGSTLYASGLLSTLDAKKSAAAVDSMVKTFDETISDRGFYQRFFLAVDAVLARMPPEQTAADVQKVAPHASESDTSQQSPQAVWPDVSQRALSGTYDAAPQAVQPAAPLGAPQYAPLPATPPTPPTPPDAPQAVQQYPSEPGSPTVQPLSQQGSQQTTLSSAPPSAGQGPLQDVQDGFSQPLPQESRRDVPQTPTP